MPKTPLNAPCVTSAEMVALVTDARYRMVPALIRALARAGVTVYTCDPAEGALPGACSRYVRAHFRTGANAEELEALLARLGARHECRPALLPVGAGTLLRAAEHRAQLARVAGLCLPAPETLSLLNDKAALARLAGTLGIPVPGESGALPCVVKPICGERLGLHAAARYKICRTAEERAAAVARFTALSGEAPIVQEYLPGGGYGCSFAAENGEIRALLCHKRLREYPVSGGPSTCCVSVELPVLRAQAEKLVRALRFSGVAMLEYKEDSGRTPRLLECNPRVWGSFPLTAVAESALPFNWFALCWNAGNPGAAVPLKEDRPLIGRKMTFFPSDYAAALKSGQCGRALLDHLNPAVHDGLFALRDPRPALVYYRSLWKRGNRS